MHLSKLLAKFSLWKVDLVNHRTERGEPLPISRIAETILVGSASPNQTIEPLPESVPLPTSVNHRPVLDFDFECTVIPSTTPGKCHLYIDKLLTYEQYSKLLDTLHEIGMIERGVHMLWLQRGLTQVRAPWVAKGPEEKGSGEPDAH